jgi:HNH endonuclease
MTATGETLLTLQEASLHLRFHPYLVLKCVTYQARKNGGIKLTVHDKDGEPHFLRAELDAFSEDLRRPWVKNETDERPNIPTYFQEALRFEAFLSCGLCKESLATDFAHIEPWEDCLHHHPGNLICLCSRCHTGFDREKRISAEDIRTAKQRLQERLLRLIAEGQVPMGEHFTSLQELCAAIEDLLTQNELVFLTFGPQSPLAEVAAGPTAADVWHRERKKTILPNNRRIIDLLQQHRRLYESAREFPDLAEQFIAHARSYEAYVEEVHDTHQYFLFPKLFAERVKVEARKK